MKQTPEMQEIQENMRPGVITLEGFLGSDSRNLIDILLEDEGIVQRLELTHEAIAHRMEKLRDAGKEGLGEFVSVPPHFDVRISSVRGKLPSPFGGKGLYPKINTTVVNKELNREITFTDLQIHLIKNHGFYEGRGSRFRLEPRDLMEILKIIPQQ
ncbi:MAG: hypothetical protein KAU17_04645 [Spirochaetales bacterium]|nr:hypothetical protein [Spirochaetales bacterium]